MSFDGIWIAAGWMVGAVGVAVALWAFLWDRARGRRRCGKCWYDMGGVPGLRCPECGREAADEKGLRRTRRGWRFAFLGAVLALAGGAGVEYPSVRAKGWLSIVPTTALIPFVPPASNERWWDAAAQSWVLHPVSAELERRVDAGFWGWQWRALLERSRCIETRARWPEDTPLHVSMRVPHWLGHCEMVANPGESVRGGRRAKAGTLLWESCGNATQARLHCEQDQQVGLLAPGEEGVEFDVSLRRLPSAASRPGLLSMNRGAAPVQKVGVISVPVRCVPTLDEAIAPVRGPCAERVFREAVKLRSGFRAEGGGRGAWLSVVLDRSAMGESRGLAVAFCVDLLKDGEQVESQAIAVTGDDLWAIVSGRTDEGGSCWLSRLDRRAWDDPAERAKWAVRFRGDPERALTRWAAESYWDGDLVIPLGELTLETD